MLEGAVAGRDAYCQAWGPKFNAGTHIVREESRLPQDAI